ncbi:hypothetical protein [Leclercia adecarboxylata]|uniref:hypothetical protein n=1 Tax=Leclercia adecarboxylata TaxID=83655 RepID=UPI0021E70F7B|nr:hypothetical protein [Leclercia adecarboxylata]MCV3303695.1 hypothetical protein [Leclercia adecarboxylata]MCV3306426.1 hypothetical protein [Leclercia adecarboxylata]
MPSAVCFCPEFVAANIKDIRVFSGFFLGAMMSDDKQIIFDSEGKIKLDYLRSCKLDKDSFYLLHKWEEALKTSTPGKVLLSTIDAELKDVKDIIVCSILRAPTTFDKHLFVLDNGSYSSYVSELIRQKVDLFNSSNISLISEEALMRQPINFTKFDSDLCWVIQRLGRRSAKGKTEDEFNDYIRDMLSAKNYMIKDQTREGESQSGKQAGELDLIIEDKGDLYSIIEALILESVDKANILKHFSKLVSNYNPLLVKRLFLITYYMGGRFDDWCERYVNYLNELSPSEMGLKGHEVISINVIETDFIGLKKIEQHFTYAGQHYFCIHYAVKMNK